MTRAAALVVVVGLLPNGCAGLIAKAMGKGDEAPASSATATSATTAKASAKAASGPSAPTATTPPVWTPPPAPKASPKDDDDESEELAEARALMKDRDYKKVRALLEKKAHAHDATTEEAKVLIEACTALKDKRCVKDVKTRYRKDLAR